MPGNRRILVAMLGLLALAGMALILLASVGDAGVMAATGGVYAALESAGEHENLALRGELYEVVKRLQLPWAAANMLGFVVLGASLVAMVAVWRARR